LHGNPRACASRDGGTREDFAPVSSPFPFATADLEICVLLFSLRLFTWSLHSLGRGSALKVSGEGRCPLRPSSPSPFAEDVRRWKTLGILPRFFRPTVFYGRTTCCSPAVPKECINRGCSVSSFICYLLFFSPIGPANKVTELSLLLLFLSANGSRCVIKTSDPVLPRSPLSSQSQFPDLFSTLSGLPGLRPSAWSSGRTAMGDAIIGSSSPWPLPPSYPQSFPPSLERFARRWPLLAKHFPSPSAV